MKHQKQYNEWIEKEKLDISFHWLARLAWKAAEEFYESRIEQHRCKQNNCKYCKNTPCTDNLLDDILGITRDSTLREDGN